MGNNDRLSIAITVIYMLPAEKSCSSLQSYLKWKGGNPQEAEGSEK